MMKSIIFLGTTFCFAAPGREVLAQINPSEQARKAGQKTNPVTSALVLASTDLDRTIETLPPNFDGHDIALVYSALEERRNLSAKSEFETTEQWHGRQETMLLEPITGSMTVKSIWHSLLMAALFGRYTTRTIKSFKFMSD